MSHFLGGHRVTYYGFLAPGSIYVDFISEYESGFLWQLYENRVLVGRTYDPKARRVWGQIRQTDIPLPLTLVRVSPDDAQTDFGDALPLQPWNRFYLRWNGAASSDATRFEITSSTTPGGAVNPANSVARVTYEGARSYERRLPTLRRSGLWNFAITAHDNTKPNGNPGLSIPASVSAIVMPPDVKLNRTTGHRFEVSVAGGVASLSWVYGEYP